MSSLRRRRPAVSGVRGDPQAAGSAVRIGSSGFDPDQPQPRRWLTFLIVALALFMGSVDQTIVATALRAIQDDLDSSLNVTAWSLSIYALGQLVAMPIAGRLSDLYGRRTVFLVAVTLFTVASLLCGLCTSIYQLIPLRFVQALGGGAFMPSATGIVSDVFGRDRDRALGLFATIWPIGGLAGPALGGVFVEFASWREIFLINVPLGVLVLVLTLRIIPARQANRVAGGRIDQLGVAMLAVGLLGLMLGFTSLGSGRVAVYSWSVFGPGLLGIVVLTMFVVRARKVDSPVVPVEFLYGPHFRWLNLVNFGIGAAILGFASLVPLFAQEKYGISVFEAGGLLSARALGMIAVAGLTTFAMRRTGLRLPMLVGMTLVALGIILLPQTSPSSPDPQLWLALSSVLVGVGMGMAMPANNNTHLRLSRGHYAAVTGVSGMIRQSGGIITLSITTSLVARHGTDPRAFDVAFTAIGVYLVVTIPLLFLIPDYRGAFESLAPHATPASTPASTSASPEG